MKPMYALHSDANGQVLAAKDFDSDYQLTSWIRDMDIRPGDSITFNATAVREAEVDPVPAFIETPPNPAAPALAETDDQPF